MDTQIKSMANDVGKALQAEYIDGNVPVHGHWGNDNGVDSLMVPKYFSDDYRDHLRSSNSNVVTRIHRYYHCGPGGASSDKFVIYASLNNPSPQEVQNFRDIRDSCGHGITHAPEEPNLTYNYARIFNR